MSSSTNTILKYRGAALGIADVRKEAKYKLEEVPLSFRLLLLCIVCTSSIVPTASTKMVKITHLKIGFEKYSECSQAQCQTQRAMLKIEY